MTWITISWEIQEPSKYFIIIETLFAFIKEEWLLYLKKKQFLITARVCNDISFLIIMKNIKLRL